MKYRLDTYGVPLECSWNTSGILMEHLWSTYEYLWNTYDIPTEYQFIVCRTHMEQLRNTYTYGMPGDTYAIPMEFLWNTSGVPMQSLWNAYRIPLGDLWHTLPMKYLQNSYERLWTTH